MILLRLEGGLGNQMFQYALARNLSLKHRVPLRFDIHTYKTNPIADCSYWLESWNIDIKNNLATPEEIRSFEKYRAKKGRRWFLYNAVFSNPKKYVEEQYYWFNPEVLNTVPPAMLHGWWQSEKYFQTIRDTLLQDFTLRAIPDARNTKIALQMKEVNSVAIQVRRKDYVSNPKTRHYHGELPFAYYQEGIKRITEKHGTPSLFVFSDDVDWVRTHMPFVGECTYVDWNEEDTIGAISMWLISQCRHQVIGNSSFGWWGAWLNTYPEKQVVAPRLWVAAKTVSETCDVAPQGWTLLDAEYIRT